VGCLEENTIRDFVDARLEPVAMKAVEAHARVCASCDERLHRAPPDLSQVALSMTTPAVGPAPVPRDSHPGLTVGTSIGRYTVLGLVGRGGLGEVYAAYDPDLDRRVALKLMRAEAGARDDGGQERLRREAQAIAKLSHRNVVVVHDVGTFSGRVFVAMEFVDGGTLKEWLAEESRSRAEILMAFANAARGLGAAHAAGMVHRDFKPQNVMMRKDGSVLVTDFGLVRQLGDDSAATEPELNGELASALANEPALGLTRTGDVVGTPAYMAPEQFTGPRTDARSDQFSFCVALYEALYGERPFDGQTFGELRINVLDGRPRPAPDKTSVPAWLRRVLTRGLAVDPEARFPSMAALSDALLNDPTVRRRKWTMAAGAVVVMVALALVVKGFGVRERRLCAAGGARWAGIWEAGAAASPRKEAISLAFDRTGKSYAAAAYKATSRLLDDYVGRWVGMYRDGCEATRVRDDQSAEVLALRMSCLEDRLGNVRALTDVFTNADTSIVLNAVTAAGALPELDSCADVALLRAAPAQDAATRPRVKKLREELARVTALRASGQCALADQKGTALIDEVRATGYQPLLAETLSESAHLGDWCGSAQLAVDRSKEAYGTAVASRADRVAVEAAANIPVLAVNRLGQKALAVDWSHIARATLARIGRDDRLEAFLAGVEAFLEDDPERRVVLSRQAQVLTQRALGADHPRALEGTINFGDALEVAGRYDEALVVDREIRRSLERLMGPEHPILGNAANNECEVLNRLGRFAEARVACRRALDIWTGAGSDAGVVSFGRTGLGLALLGEGKPAEAVEPLEAAVRERVDKHLAPALLGESRFALARALWSRPADRSRALILARQARADSATDTKVLATIDTWLAKAR
jgi:predicted Ser/Thr protein kinase